MIHSLHCMRLQVFEPLSLLSMHCLHRGSLFFVLLSSSSTASRISVSGGETSGLKKLIVQYRPRSAFVGQHSPPQPHSSIYIQLPFSTRYQIPTSAKSDVKRVDERPSSFNSETITSKRKMSAKSAGESKNAFPANIPHAPKSLISSDFDQTRTKLLTLNTPLPREKPNIDNPCIVYWMMRDMRTVDNWALLFAQNLAAQKEVPLRVVYNLPPPPDTTAAGGQDGAPPHPADMAMTVRHGMFLLDGLKIVAEELASSQVPFDILRPKSRSLVGKSIHSYCTHPSHNALAVVCDMSPLRHFRQWTEQQAAPMFETVGIPLYQVDAHNIVPVWIASPKREVGARTLRPKINNLFSKYCTHFPEFSGNAHLQEAEVEGRSNTHDWEMYREFMNLDESIQSVDGMKAGHDVAMERFQEFCSSTQYGLKNFDTLRNDPNYSKVCSNLSPWINFGQVSFQRLALNVRALKRHPNGTAAFIEEGVVRRELSDNFVYYTPDAYDNMDSAADWARESLDLHSVDERESVYTWKELEKAMTHDDLWNAAQLQLVREGGMHGFLRMYWAKKVLEWTVSPAYALATAQYFNDRYAYDGNDPNGFVGVGWSIVGIHDMGWKERPIFGKIRYMNYAGCKRKFKIDQFVARYRGASENAATVSEAKSGGGQTAGKKRKQTSLSFTKK